MRQIAWFETIGGVPVPVDEFGEYLQWRDLPPHTTLAEPLLEMDPSEYLIGSAEYGEFILDYGLLPDGQVVIAILEPTREGFAPYEPPPETGLKSYKVLDRTEAAVYARALTQHLIDAMAEEGYEHSFDWTCQDVWRFADHVAAACGLIRAGGHSMDGG